MPSHFLNSGGFTAISSSLERFAIACTVGADLRVTVVNLRLAPDFKFKRLFFFLSFTLGFNQAK
jgi:acetyl esterase/lipase